MAASRTIELVDSTRVVVPDSLKLLTPYVLSEQLDWFEDEIRFLRIALAPGDTTLDIGANYGTYTLSMAQRVGPTGKVFSYEPASTTAGFLREGIGANGFANVTLSQCALSSHAGSAGKRWQLSLSRPAPTSGLRPWSRMRMQVHLQRSGNAHARMAARA